MGRILSCSLLKIILIIKGYLVDLLRNLIE